jgi:electron transfer flavoprotein alpha subunit
MLPAARSSVLRSARSQLRRSHPIPVPHYSAFARLASTFAVLEQKDGKFQPASLAAVTAGTKLGGSITAFIAGSGVKSVAEEIGKAKGIEKVIYVENGAYDKVRAPRRSQWISSLTCGCRVFPRTMRHS